MQFVEHNYNRQSSIAVGEIARIVNADLVPDNSELKIRALAPLHMANEGDLSFLDNPKYIEQFRQSKASACILAEKFAQNAPQNMVLLICKEPYRAYAETANLLYPEIEEDEKIHPSAIIHKTAKIGKNVSIGANTIISRLVEIGDGTKISSNVTISTAKLGKNCIIHSGVRIGQDGFGFAMGKTHIKVPQLGGVIIGDDVEIGANTCIDRGSGSNTLIGEGTKIDNLVQIGHNVEIGKFCIIVSQVGIAGSTKLGDYVVIGGKGGVAGHPNIGSGAKVAAYSGIMRDIEAGATVGGIPAMSIRDWHKTNLAIAKLTKSEKKND